MRAQRPLALIHTDICGPMHEESLNGSKYFLLLVDDYSRMQWVYLLKQKNEALERIREFKVEVENQKGSTIQAFRTDQGGEFKYILFENFCRQYGIRRKLITSYTLQRNRVMERRNTTIVEVVRSLLNEAHLSKNSWAEAVLTAVCMLNRSTSAANRFKTPYELWYGKSPQMSHLKIFGSIAYACIPNEIRRKLDDKSVKCIFIGCAKHEKAYKLFDRISHKVLISIYIIIDEKNVWEGLEDNKKE